MGATDTTVATDVWSQIDPKWVDMTIGPFRCICGGTVGCLGVYDDTPQICEGCGRTYWLAVRVWRTEPAVTSRRRETGVQPGEK